MTPQARAAERAALLAALTQTAGHQGEAAALLGWPLRTLTRRLADPETRQAADALSATLAWPKRTARATAARWRP